MPIEFHSRPPGLSSVQRMFLFVCLFVCFQQQTVFVLNDHCSANGHVSLISSLIAHSLGDIGYFCVIKNILWAPPSLFAIANTRFVVCFRLLTVVQCSKRSKTFNKTFAVFAILNGPQMSALQRLMTVALPGGNTTIEFFLGFEL